jgi:prepilin-type N-terminal cleavage/methylation domain-containing protein
MSRSKGFTVIEMVVVMTIIAIMAAVTLPLGLGWIAEFRFNSAARALSRSVLMARMRGIENRAVFTITASQTSISSPFGTGCPGMIFTTNVDHGLSQPNPAVAGALVLPPPLPAFWSPVAPCRCVKSLPSAMSTTPGDTVMFSGLNHTTSMNGLEFEVIQVPATNQIAVQHAVSPTLGDTAGPDTTGTVRNLVAPGRLRIVPAVSKVIPTTDNEESFIASAYTVKEEGSSIVFRYDTEKFEVTLYPGNPPIPAGTPVLDPLDLSRNFAEIRFDNRGFPKATVVGNAAPNTTATNTTIRIDEKVPALRKKDARKVTYLISTTGKVNTQAWEN